MAITDSTTLHSYPDYGYYDPYYYPPDYYYWFPPYDFRYQPPINFCPYCGKRLETPKCEETSDSAGKKEGNRAVDQEG